MNKLGRFLDSLTARRYNFVGVTRRKHRTGSRNPAPAGPENCHCAWPTFAEASVGNKGMAWFLQSGYKAGWALRVSRYNVDANDIFITVQKFNALQRRGPDLSPVTNLFWEQEQKQNLWQTY